MRIIESRSIDNQAGLLGSRLITGTNAIEGAFQSFIVAEDTIVTKVYNSIGIDVTSKLGLTSITLKAGAFISMPKGDYFSSIKLASGSVVAYFTSHGGQTITVDAYLNEFLARVGSSYLEASECVKAHLQQLINIGLLQKASLIMSPSMYEEDLVKSVVPQDGSGDLTFTRASDGTRINSAGLVEDCPWNLATNSENFSALYGGINATISNNTTSAPNATTTADSLLETTANDIHAIYGDYTQQSGVQYTYSVYVKSISGRNVRISGSVGFSGPIALVDLSNGSLLSGSTGASVESVGSGWYRISLTATTTTTTVRVIIYSMDGTSTTFAGSTSNGVYIWGAQLNIGSTAKPYFPTTDRLNVPRLTYQNGGGGCPSLLLEKQSTNLVLYSQAFTNTWLTFFGTTTDNQVVSPDGTQNASKVLLGASGAVLRQSVSGLTNGQPYTFSCYIKQGSGVTASLQIADVGSTITLTNDWVRYTYTDNWNTSNNIVDIELSGANGSYCYIWGAQLEAGTYATSYIPTTSSSATRVADGCYKTGISSLIGQTEGVVFLDSYFDEADKVNLSVTDGTSSNFIQIETTSGAAVVANINSGGFSQASMSTSSSFFTSGQRLKIGIAYKANDFALYINGVQIATDSSGSAPSTDQFVCARYNGSLAASQRINELILFKTRLTNSELASLTTI